MLFTRENTRAEIWQNLVHELNRGALDSKHPFRYLTLATMSNQSPEQRMVVLRKVDDDLNFYFFTDSRTDKVSQLSQNPNAEFLGYHPNKRTQIRVKGRIQVHHQNSLSQQMWQRIQGDAQTAYNSTLAPGSEIEAPNPAYDWPAEMDDRYFSVLELIPSEIEALQLNKLTHIRVKFTRKGEGWNGIWLVP